MIFMENLSNIVSLFSFLSFLFSRGVHVSGKVYRIVPARIPTYEYECLINNHFSCLTFSQFAQNATNYVASSTRLYISGGNHSLDVKLSISNIAEFAMLPANNSSNPIVITCASLATFNFTNIDSINLNGLKFDGCNSSIFKAIHQLMIEYSTFINSKSPLTIIDSNVNMTGTNFLSNSGSSRSDLRLLQTLEKKDSSVGGALILMHSTTTIESCNFHGNTASYGGAIFSEFNSSTTISNSNFTNNRAKCHKSGYCAGGALLVDENGIVSIINYSRFLNNTSNFDGGMAAVMNATLLVSHSYVHMNTANRYGGAISAFRNSNITLESSWLCDNNAEHDGGAVYLQESNTTISNCEISNNNARVDGVLFMKQIIAVSKC